MKINFECGMALIGLRFRILYSRLAVVFGVVGGTFRCRANPADVRTKRRFCMV